METKNVRTSKEECEKNILGKILGSKSANLTSLKNTLNELWSHNGDLNVVELGRNFL